MRTPDNATKAPEERKINVVKVESEQEKDESVDGGDREIVTSIALVIDPNGEGDQSESKELVAKVGDKIEYMVTAHTKSQRLLDVTEQAGLTRYGNIDIVKRDTSTDRSGVLVAVKAGTITLKASLGKIVSESVAHIRILPDCTVEDNSSPTEEVNNTEEGTGNDPE
jgi:Holliday junction resolvase-like predicted endonuclease